MESEQSTKPNAPPSKKTAKADIDVDSMKVYRSFFTNCCLIFVQIQQVNELKAELTKRGLKCNGKKADLQARLREAINEGGGGEGDEDEENGVEGEEQNEEDYTAKLWELKDKIVEQLTTNEMKKVLQKNNQVCFSLDQCYGYRKNPLLILWWCLVCSVIKAECRTWPTTLLMGCSRAPSLRCFFLQDSILKTADRAILSLIVPQM